MNSRSRIAPGIAAAAAALGLVLVLPATPASSGVYNDHGSNRVAQVVWGSGDPETGEGAWGGIYGDIESWGTIVGLWEDDAHAIPCDAGTPDDPTDDYTTFAGVMRNGESEGDVTVARTLKWATVRATLTLETVEYDYCALTWDVVAVEPEVSVELDLVAVAQPTHWTDVFHDRLAGVYNHHDIVRSQERAAAGTALVGGETYDFESGLISNNTWSTHENWR